MWDGLRIRNWSAISCEVGTLLLAYSATKLDFVWLNAEILQEIAYGLLLFQAMLGIKLSAVTETCKLAGTGCDY